MSSLITPDMQYGLLSKGSRAASRAGSNYLLAKGWKLVTKKDPPLNPATPGVLWSEALAWGALIGLVGGVFSVVVRRLTAEWWRKYQGAKPAEPNA